MLVLPQQILTEYVGDTCKLKDIFMSFKGSFRG